MVQSITAAHSQPEHPRKGLETGLKDTQSFVFAGNILDRQIGFWGKSNRLDAVLGRALARLTVQYPEQAEEGFTATELAEEVGRLIGRQWVPTDEPEKAAERVRTYFDQLEETWPTKDEGIKQAFLDERANYYALPDRKRGGGTGNPTRYKILLCPLDGEESDPSLRAIGDHGKTSNDRVGNPDNGSIRYICEDLTDAPLMSRMFTGGYALLGFRRALYFGLVSIGILLLLTPLLLFALSMMGSRSLTTLVYSVLSMGVICYSVWISIGAFIYLGEKRILLAPWWMQPISEDLLLELRRPPRYPHKTIKAATYVGQCPACGGRVSVKSGGLRYMGRLVGRCEEAPDAHIYSFDHVLRQGRRLDS